MGRISGQKSGHNKKWVMEAGMEDDIVKRWLVQVDEYRWLMYDNEEDIEDWDTILEISLPKNMALMLDYTQNSYFQMQSYFESQWEVMQRLLAEDEAVEYYGVGDTGPETAQDGDQLAFQRQFESILKENGLDSLEKPTEDE